MPASDAQARVFRRLRDILARHVPPLVVTADKPTYFAVDAPRPDLPSPRRYFGGVRINKSYVSFYLMPVYAAPRDLGGVSPALRKRMQGKSCFNFSAEDDALFAELAELTDRSVGDFSAYGAVRGTGQGPPNLHGVGRIG